MNFGRAYNFKGQRSTDPGRLSEEGRSRRFWIILACVTCVISSLLYFIADARRKSGKEKSVPKNEARKNEKKGISFPKNKDERKNLRTICERAAELLGKKQAVEARDAVLEVLSSGFGEDDEYQRNAAEILNRANSIILMSDIPCPERRIYTIKQGDNLVKIANSFNTTVELLRKRNGLDPENPIIHSGKTLSVFCGEWLIKIKKKCLKLYLCNGENLFKTYNISAEENEERPTGNFEISVKRKNPASRRNGKTPSSGLNENIPCVSWMELKPAGRTDPDFKGYRIYGTRTTDEETGRKNGGSRVRMSNDDFDELYCIMPLRTPVIIED